MKKIAFVFAGQGAQAVGMGKDLYDNIQSVKHLFDLSEETREMCFNGPQESLDITSNTQPAIFLTDLSCAVALGVNKIVADGVAGFSVGEIPAACYAGLMDSKQALDFVKHRAATMHDCAEAKKGNMFAVLKLTVSQVGEICDQLPDCYPVNYNCPGQTVVACAESVAMRLQEKVKQAKGKSIKLAVSGAFHSPFMNEASKSALEYLENVQYGKIRIPLYSNLTGEPYGNPIELLSQQINHPVLWQKTIENMIDDDFGTFIEVGPGKTLSGLIKKINKDVRVLNVSDMESLESTVRELNNQRVDNDD